VGTPKITIKDVAQKAGVSIASVSRFFNNPSLLKESSRRKIERIIKEVNYQPFIYARRLAGGKLGVFSLVIPGYEGLFYSYYAMEIIRSVAVSMAAKGVDLQLHVFWNKDSLKTSLVDGIIFSDVLGNESQMERIAKEGLPFVVMNKKLDAENVNYVAINNFKGSYDATEFLLNHGHKKIAHLAGNLHVQCAAERLDGYKNALQKNGIPVKDTYIKVTNFSRKEARERLGELFSGSEPPTAILCCSDEVAGEVITFAEENKITIPKDLSVIGFDDNPNYHWGSLALTTVRQPLSAMCAAAVDILDEAVKNKNAVVKKIVLDTELVMRDTVSFH
jgi:LacI family transcriptional regulator